MPIQFKISITKSIIYQSKNCGVNNDVYEMGRNCAIAVALQNIFPAAYVTNFYIFPFGIDNRDANDLKIPLPSIAQQFIKLFDGFYLAPNLRMLLPEFEFTVDVPDEVIDGINIDEIKELINSSKKATTSCRSTHNVSL